MAKEKFLNLKKEYYRWLYDTFLFFSILFLSNLIKDPNKGVFASQDAEI